MKNIKNLSICANALKEIGMNIEQRKLRRQNRDLALFLMVPTAIIAKIIQLFFLPERYFFDSWRMIGMLTEAGGMASWSGYQTAVDFHRAINIFHLSTTTQFSIVYGLIMTPVCMLVVSKVKEMEVREVLFTLMATGVLNIYVFNLNKEMPQILYFFAIYIVISIPINNNFIKTVGCALIYYWESTSFRSYYIIMAALVIALYFIFTWLRRKHKISKIHIMLTVVSCFVLVFVFFYLSSFIAPDDYNEALNTRDGTTQAVDAVGTGGANSAIRNPIEVNGNLGVFMYDYVINAVRMMIPVELIFKSPGYIPFFVYQIFIMLYLFRTLKNIKLINQKMVVVLSCFVAYFFGSVVFEPDFGSWVRHEATTFPILQLMAYNSVNLERQYRLEN